MSESKAELDSLDQETRRTADLIQQQLKGEFWFRADGTDLVLLAEPVWCLWRFQSCRLNLLLKDLLC